MPKSHYKNSLSSISMGFIYMFVRIFDFLENGFWQKIGTQNSSKQNKYIFYTCNTMLHKTQCSLLILYHTIYMTNQNLLKNIHSFCFFVNLNFYTHKFNLISWSVISRPFIFWANKMKPFSLIKNYYCSWM